MTDDRRIKNVSFIVPDSLKMCYMFICTWNRNESVNKQIQIQIHSKDHWNSKTGSPTWLHELVSLLEEFLFRIVSVHFFRPTAESWEAWFGRRQLHFCPQSTQNPGNAKMNLLVCSVETIIFHMLYFEFRKQSYTRANKLTIGPLNALKNPWKVPLVDEFGALHWISSERVT